MAPCSPQHVYHTTRCYIVGAAFHWRFSSPSWTDQTQRPEDRRAVQLTQKVSDWGSKDGIFLNDRCNELCVFISVNRELILLYHGAFWRSSLCMSRKRIWKSYANFKCCIYIVTYCIVIILEYMKQYFYKYLKSNNTSWVLQRLWQLNVSWRFLMKTYNPKQVNFDSCDTGVKIILYCFTKLSCLLNMTTEKSLQCCA